MIALIIFSVYVVGYVLSYGKNTAYKYQVFELLKQKPIPY